MPTIPRYDSPQVEQRPVAGTRFDSVASPGLLGKGAEAAADLGAGLSALGGSVQSIEAAAALKAKQEADQLRVDDALNKVKERVIDLTFAQDKGFVHQKGEQALKRESGKPLADEYAGELDKHIGEVTQGLSTPDQRRAFAMRANDIRTSFYGGVRRHEGEQFKSYALSVDEGNIRNAQNDIGLFYNDPDKVDNAVRSIEASTARAGRTLGRSASQIEADTRKATSNAHMLALTAALQKNDMAYADGYLKKYSKQMDADDILKAQGHITKGLVTATAATVADKVFVTAAPALKGTDFERMVGITKGTESGNRQFDAQGRTVTSSAGALGIMQVMPGTGPEAAKLAGLPWDLNKLRNDAGYAETLGRAYLAQQLRDFGGRLDYAWAAYNAGPGATRAAIDKAAKVKGDFADAAGNNGIPKNNFLAYLPAETQNYVAKNMAAYAKGEGAPAKPTIEDLQDNLRASPQYLALPPEGRKLAEDRLTHRFTESERSQKQREETALANAQRWLVANNGAITDMPPNIRNAVPPGKVDDVLTFAGKIAGGRPVATDWETYDALRAMARTNPKGFASLDMGAYFGKLAPAQRESLLDLQDKTSKPDKALEVAALESQLGDAHDRMGFTASDREKRGLFDETVKRDIDAAQKASGKILDYDQRQAIINRNMMKRENGFFQFGSTRLYEARNAGKADEFVVEVPKGDRTRIENALRAAGRPVTDAAVRELYLRVNGAPAPRAPAARPGVTGDF